MTSSRAGSGSTTDLPRIIIKGTMLVIPGVICLVGLLVPASSGLISWLVVLGLLAIFTFAAGYLLNGKVLGCLIDGRNQMSLSRLQMIVWTILIISAYFTEVLIWVQHGAKDPLGVGIPQEMWAVLGISTTSLVGTPLIRNSKKDKEPRPEEEAEIQKTTERLAQQDSVPVGDVKNIGQIIVTANPDQARVSDMFKGDEITDSYQLDLGKIQMFYFTLVLVLVYGVQLGHLFWQGSPFDNMPAVPISMVALLGISHAGYLGNKAIPG